MFCPAASNDPAEFASLVPVNITPGKFPTGT
jgi:hypothetical protein